ncbi:MAG: hypothetical protein RIB86_02815 [Imperialibacter sp.]
MEDDRSSVGTTELASVLAIVIRAKGRKTDGSWKTEHRSWRRYDSAGISVGNRQTPERLGERRKLEDGKPKQASVR